MRFEIAPLGWFRARDDAAQQYYMRYIYIGINYMLNVALIY